jgi:GNAT superfamily N-acetyltransferase
MGALNSADLDRLATLHRENLPDSAVSGLGQAYARAFYRYVETSQKELLILHRAADGQLDGAGVVSLQPESLERRLALATPLLLHALFHPLWFLVKVHGVLFGHADGDAREVTAKVRGLPELLIIYSDAARRDAGVGSDLIHTIEAALVVQGITRYCVRTTDDPANRALGFYSKHSFEALGCTRGFRVFAKTLTSNQERLSRSDARSPSH